MFHKIALAIAFSPRMEALISESKRLKDLFNAELLLIHIGEKSQVEEEALNTILEKHNIDQTKTKVVWETGKPAKKIIEICEKEGVDLLVAGALKNEGFFKYYL